MKKWRRVVESLVVISMGAMAAWVLLNQPLQAEKTANPSLNKAAVGPDTPFIVLGMGCFWGAEKRMQALAGVLDVEAGYAGGDLPQPGYQTLHDTEAAIREGADVKNHAEVVKVYYDPKQTTLEKVLAQFWESHNPTQGDRQGNDVGSNYRSAIFYRGDEEHRWAEKTRAVYQANLAAAGIAALITTEIAPLKNYTAAEDYHQDYLQKNPLGYCGLGGTGVAYLDAASPMQAVSSQAAQLAISPAGFKQDWQASKLDSRQQLIAFEAADCGYCQQFDKEVLAAWDNPVPIVSSYSTTVPDGWRLNQTLFATPTIVLFKDRREVARYTGYQGAQAFWQWLHTAAGQDHKS